MMKKQSEKGFPRASEILSKSCGNLMEVSMLQVDMGRIIHYLNNVSMIQSRIMVWAMGGILEKLWKNTDTALINDVGHFLSENDNFLSNFNYSNFI